MKIPFVDLKSQYLSIKDEIDYSINQVLNETIFINGERVAIFESNFANLIDSKYCISVANGTDALIIALKSLGIGIGDEVITVANSFIATSEAITATGAKVVFVDNLSDTYNINPNDIEKKITNKTKAIIPVHLYGQPAEMTEILKIAKKNNLYVIEDCAQAHLAEYRFNEKWVKVGTLGDIATFSFFPGKNLGAYGDAGAVLTNNGDLAKKARMLANHGRIAKYNHEIEGFNSRLDTIQAAVLNVKIKYIKKWTEQRRKVANDYMQLLKPLSELQLPYYDSGKVNPVWHLFVIRCKERHRLQEYLQSKGISTGIHYPIALPALDAYKYMNINQSEFSNSIACSKEILSLPIFPELSNEQIQYVVDSIYAFFGKQ